MQILAYAAHAQGFTLLGTRLETVVISRKLPPIVNLTGTSVKIVVSKTPSVPQEVADVLLSKTRAEILKDQARSFRLDDQNPETIIRCHVTGFELTEQHTTQQVGNQTSTSLVVIGNMEASVEIVDTQNRGLDSDNLHHKYEQTFPLTGPTGGIFGSLPGKKQAPRIPTNEERRSMVVEGLARKIAQRVVPIAEPVEVPLPRGKAFEDVRRLAEAKRWGAVLEAAEKIPPFPKKDDDAYRTYAIGMANEAMAYTDAKDANQVQDYLSRAQTFYDQAKEGKHDEKFFSPPSIRVQESLDHCLAIQNALRVKQAVTGNKDAGGKSGPAAPAGKPAAEMVNNEYLIELKKKGASDKLLMVEIQDAADPKFDITPVGISHLVEAKLSDDVILAVRAKMRKK
jgi:hypothetical protein